MRKGLTVLTMLAMLAAACTQPQQQASLWFEGTTLDEALEQAKTGQNLVLIDFYADT